MLLCQNPDDRHDQKQKQFRRTNISTVGFKSRIVNLMEERFLVNPAFNGKVPKKTIGVAMEAAKERQDWKAKIRVVRSQVARIV